MILSIVIPTYNEEENVRNVVSFIKKNIRTAEVEVIISDGGSEDNTLEEARKAGAEAVLSPAKGRAGQMNYGVSISKGDVLYFIHADCYPPSAFVNEIEKAIDQLVYPLQSVYMYGRRSNLIYKTISL